VKAVEGPAVTVIDVPVHMLHRGHAVIALTAAGPKLRGVFISERHATVDAKAATRWYKIRHIVAPVRGGKVEVIV
jgi:hypothetical protein